MAASNVILMLQKWPVGVLQSSHPKILLESFVVLSFTIPDYRHSLMLNPAVTTQPSSLFSLSFFDGFIFILRSTRLRILFDSKHAARVTIGTGHAIRNVAFTRTCNEIMLRVKCKIYVSAHHLYGHAGNTGNSIILLMIEPIHLQKKYDLASVLEIAIANIPLGVLVLLDWRLSINGTKWTFLLFFVPSL